MLSDKEKIENAKPVIKAIEALREIRDRDVSLGLYDEETMRLTIEARKKVVKELSKQGLSERQIAKTIGGSRGMVRRDLNGPKKPKKRAKKAHKEIEANDFIRRALESMTTINNEVHKWYLGVRKTISEEDRDALIRTFHQCGNEYTLLAQFIEEEK
jgi:predicted transcriptional regulator